MKIVIAEAVTDTLHELIKTNNKDWTVYSDKPVDKAAFIERIKDADAVAAYSTKFDDEVFLACQNLKYVAIPSVGASFFVDMEAAKRHNVTVMNCPGYNASAVAELAIGLMVDVLRGITQKNYDLKEGRWNPEKPLGRLIRGKHVGFVGHGNIATTIESMLSGWGVTTSYINSKSTTLDIDELMRISDIIVVCCPQTPLTDGLVSEERIKMMRSTAILISVSRGSVINEDALYGALKADMIAGAGLDVYTNEPSFGQELSPSITRFVSLPNVICTPHTAGTSEESRLVLSQMIFDNLESCENGALINIYQ